MAYESVDQLQKLLVEKVFHYAKDSKKAAGRALGVLVEVVAFYLLKSWGFERSVAIEKKIPEFGRPDITHNVEALVTPDSSTTTTCPSAQAAHQTTRILACADTNKFSLVDFTAGGGVLLTTGGVLRNSCVVANGKSSHLVATLDSDS